MHMRVRELVDVCARVIALGVVLHTAKRVVGRISAARRQRAAAAIGSRSDEQPSPHDRVVPYSPCTAPEQAALAAAIQQRRGGELIALDRMLLHSVPYARGWNAFFGEIRSGTSLDPALRELVICAVGVVNGARYEVLQHAPLFLRHGGTQAQLDALGDARQWPAVFSTLHQRALALAVDMSVVVPLRADRTLLRHLQVCVYLVVCVWLCGACVWLCVVRVCGCEWLSLNRNGIAGWFHPGSHANAVFLLCLHHAPYAQEHLGDTALVELVGTIAAYNCVSRFLVTLDVSD